MPTQPLSIADAFDRAPFRLSGVVYGALLNRRGAIEALGDAVNQPPHKAPPGHVVLQLKPRMSLVGRGEPVRVDATAPELEVGAALGLVIGRTASALREDEALAHVAGYLIAADFSVPGASLYRPSIRARARDASCAIGPEVIASGRVADPEALAVRVFVDGRRVADGNTGAVVRTAARLLAEVTDFMTLSPGDILMTGALTESPRVGAGAVVAVEIDGLGRLEVRVEADPAESVVKRARVAYAGALHDAWPGSRPGFVRLADGRELPEDAVVWLAPFAVGTIVALGLNYADHVKELSFAAQDEPLVFLKGPGAVVGHLGQTRRPADATFMHYECELAVVIGAPARRVKRADAMRHVAGYTVANDYAIRDYLENWSRPNLRVKNRDGATAIGPWLVDAGDVADPSRLELATFVNGRQTQSGHTRDLIFDIAFLIEYLSAFMTLSPGDVILTGTPEGVVGVAVGDEVVCEIESIGRLANTIVGDETFGRGRPARGHTP